MLHPFSFRCSNHASTTPFPSLLLLNTTSFHLAGKSPTFPFLRRPFNPPALRSVHHVRAVSSLPLFDFSGGKGYVHLISPENPCLRFIVNLFVVIFLSLMLKLGIILWWTTQVVLNAIYPELKWLINSTQVWSDLTRSFLENRVGLRLRSLKF